MSISPTSTDIIALDFQQIESFVNDKFKGYSAIGILSATFVSTGWIITSLLWQLCGSSDSSTFNAYMNPTTSGINVVRSLITNFYKFFGTFGRIWATRGLQKSLESYSNVQSWKEVFKMLSTTDFYLGFAFRSILSLIFKLTGFYIFGWFGSVYFQNEEDNPRIGYIDNPFDKSIENVINSITNESNFYYKDPFNYYKRRR